MPAAKELAYARCAATASSAAHLEAQADWAAGRNQAGMAAARCRPDPTTDAEFGDWPHGWQLHASRTRNSYFRDRVQLPSLPPPRQALLRSQSGPHARAWLTAIPGDVMTSLPPQAMHGLAQAVAAPAACDRPLLGCRLCICTNAALPIVV